MHDIRNYITVTAAYWAFTLTDGALRMLVLLVLHEQGYAPLQIASLFLFYEFFGVVTNLVGGWVGARFGLKSTLFCGLALQILSLGMLALWADSLSMPLVMLAQALSGIAKDLTKMSSKSYIKFVVPTDQPSRLMRWVALLTGSKNALKGAGFFLGAVLLERIGFAYSCYAMAVLLVAALLGTAVLLPRAAGKAKIARTLGLFSQSRSINWLSAARFFLFGSRDIWFVLALPIFLSANLGWEHHQVGGFLALWVVGYGVVQALAPIYVKPAQRLWPWTAALVLPLCGIVFALHQEWSIAWTIFVGLGVFGVFFASNSALHSFLIVSFADGDRVAMDVGFYYMANAGGRLVGTVLSGAAFQAGGQGRSGLELCLWLSIGFVIASAVLALQLRRAPVETR